MANQYQKQLEDVLERQVSRSEFLKFSGVAILGVIGVTGFLKNLHQSIPTKTLQKRSASGYGRSPYGR